MNHKIVELYEQLIEWIAVSLEFAASYIEVVNHALEHIAHKLGRAHGIIVASIYLFKGLEGIHRVLFKGKTKDLVSKIAKTVMSSCISVLSVAAIVCFVVVGTIPATAVLLAALSVDMVLTGFRHLRTRRKVTRLKALHKALTSDEGMTPDEKLELVTLMKGDITEESLNEMKKGDQKNLIISVEKRLKHLESKRKERFGAFTHSVVNTGLMALFMVMVVLNPVAALVVVGVISLVTVKRIFEAAKEVHEESIHKKLKSRVSLASPNSGLDSKVDPAPDAEVGLDSKVDPAPDAEVDPAPDAEVDPAPDAEVDLGPAPDAGPAQVLKANKRNVETPRIIDKKKGVKRRFKKAMKERDPSTVPVSNSSKKRRSSSG
jgi:hypothetical protein